MTATAMTTTVTINDYHKDNNRDDNSHENNNNNDHDDMDGWVQQRYKQMQHPGRPWWQRKRHDRQLLMQCWRQLQQQQQQQHKWIATKTYLQTFPSHCKLRPTPRIELNSSFPLKLNEEKFCWWRIFLRLKKKFLQLITSLLLSLALSEVVLAHVVERWNSIWAGRVWIPGWIKAF